MARRQNDDETDEARAERERQESRKASESKDPNEPGSTNVAGTGALSEAGQEALRKDPNEPGSDAHAAGTVGPQPTGTQLPEGITSEELSGNSDRRINAAQEIARSEAEENLRFARDRDAATLARQAAMRPFPSQDEADAARVGSTGPGDSTFKGE